MPFVKKYRYSFTDDVIQRICPMAVPGACIKYTQNIAHFDHGSYLTTFPAICKKMVYVDASSGS